MSSVRSTEDKIKQTHVPAAARCDARECGLYTGGGASAGLGRSSEDGRRGRLSVPPASNTPSPRNSRSGN